MHAVLSAANAPQIAWYEEAAALRADRALRRRRGGGGGGRERGDRRGRLRLIEVEYEPLPFVTTIEAALAPDAPQVHEGGNIAGEPKVYERGDADAGLRQADVVIDATYATQSALHNAWSRTAAPPPGRATR